jgi:protein TonB
MSRLSIYETRWIDLIFENRNKEYGAYQLRRDSVKSSLSALFMGLLLIASFAGMISIANYFSTGTKIELTVPDLTDEIIQVTEVVFPETIKTVLPDVKSQTTEAVIDKDQLINPVIVHPEEANPNVATNDENRNTTDATSDGTGTIGLNPTNSSGTETAIPAAVDYGNTVLASVALDKLPEFPGGIHKFYNYVGNNFEKPEMEGTNTFRVYVSFVIEKDGSMTDIKVIRDPGFGLGKEAIRVLKSLKTKWTPGMMGSKPVRTSYNLPITVKMD